MVIRMTGVGLAVSENRQLSPRTKHSASHVLSSVAYWTSVRQHSTFRMIAFDSYFLSFVCECVKLQLINTVFIPQKHYTVVCRLQEILMIVTKSQLPSLNMLRLSP